MKKMKGIRKRWMMNNISAALVIVLLAVTAFSVAMVSYYYSSMSRGLEEKTRTAVNVFGGYKVQGRGDAGKRLMDECLAVADAGASMIVLECVPKELAAEITRTVSVPVIGIGAGNQTDGQVLVMHDALGFTVGHTPKFAFNFLKETGNVSDAIKLYVSMVESGQYPTDDQSFN